MKLDRKRCIRLACAVAVLAWAAAAPPAAAQQVLPPPVTSDVCPGIDEDGMLCSADLLSGNCADFVAAANRLGGLYRDELEELPADSEGALLTTMWWGCGPGNLADITALLVKIGSPQALAVLRTQPYATIVAQRPAQTPGAPVMPGLAAPPPDCDSVTDPLQRNTCIGAQLQAARAENQNVLARCQQLVPAGLRDDFVDSQATFQSLLPTRCNAQAAGFDDKNTQTFIRSRCLVTALSDNTRGMLTAHPECRTAN